MRTTDLRRHIAEFNKSGGFEQQFKVVQDHPIAEQFQNTHLSHSTVVFKTLCLLCL